MSSRNAESRILAAARALFFEHGVPAVTTDMLAKAAQTSKMTLYKYFPSKEELLEAVVAKEVARIYEPTQVDIHSKDDFVKVIHSFCTNLLKIIFDPQIVRFDQLMISQALTNSDMSKAHFSRCYEPTIEELARLINLGKERGYLESVQSSKILADIVISAISGVTYTKGLLGFDIQKTKIKKHVSSVLSAIFNF
ncbi:TetR/AcrR family transcriptional regulator [Glaciecola sp. MH2013]|uniref:TetR/AcrR family transcriptional regulator n=1 Tax=Glaciecola sp. MH2013 TaxID=2785524 RepID=UPI00189EAD81|nr:TetR/AcrR family transcriptional regulator [Glaciecola sp. MH2013]MBF7072056.1 TetR/AcrR family transcriptional regulator [Glaciecola sp. MH2013]